MANLDQMLPRFGALPPHQSLQVVAFMASPVGSLWYGTLSNLNNTPTTVIPRQTWHRPYLIGNLYRCKLVVRGRSCCVTIAPVPFPCLITPELCGLCLTNVTSSDPVRQAVMSSQ